jgi:hypothetical protein
METLRLGVAAKAIPALWWAPILAFVFTKLGLSVVGIGVICTCVGTASMNASQDVQGNGIALDASGLYPD